MQARRLILTADDFGRSPEVNTAVVEWHRAGAITHASLMVNEPHAAAAVALARELPGLRLGLHLTLCDGVASDGSALPASPGWAGMRYAFSPRSRGVLQREITAQFERFVSFGLEPGHWDGHTHLHLHPVIFALALPVAVRHGFRFTRLVREPGPFAVVPAIFQWLSRRAMRPLQQAGIGFADRVFGLRKSGEMDGAEIARAQSYAISGVTEIYFHPGAEAVMGVPIPSVFAMRE